MTIAASCAGGRLTVYLGGELDHHEAGGAIRSIQELIDEHMPRLCALDLSEISFMDSSGIAVIINAGRKMKAIGGQLCVENPAEQARRVLETSGVGKLIAVASNG